MSESESESKNYSALWSSLRTLEMTNQFVSTSVEPTKVYNTFYGDHDDKKVCMRHQKLASGLALIGASSPDAKTVTACSVEVTYSEGSNDPEVVLRIAQNKLVDEKEKSNLQSLVDELVTEVSAKDKRVWNTKDGAFSFISLRLQDIIQVVPVTRPIRHHFFNHQELFSPSYGNTMQREDISYLNWALFSAFS